MTKFCRTLLIIGLIFFISCSNDEKNDLTSLEPLVGVWQPIKEVEVYTDGTKVEFQFSICHQKSRYTFFGDGKLTIVEFVNDEFTNDCEEKINPVLESGEWQKNTNNKYRLITTYKDIETQQAYTDDNYPDVFDFENNNDKLKFGYNDDEIIDGKQLKYYYTEFIRVN